jgi:hypothetical protein
MVKNCLKTVALAANMLFVVVRAAVTRDYLPVAAIAIAKAFVLKMFGLTEVIDKKFERVAEHAYDRIAWKVEAFARQITCLIELIDRKIEWVA